MDTFGIGCLVSLMWSPNRKARDQSPGAGYGLDCLPLAGESQFYGAASVQFGTLCECTAYLVLRHFPELLTVIDKCRNLPIPLTESYVYPSHCTQVASCLPSKAVRRSFESVQVNVVPVEDPSSKALPNAYFTLVKM